ncbi:cytochrome P450 [Gordonia hongkongensis]|uniref:cytochrome P450 n=1 Tax=Gordonia hongkongensis TaxID=1701090 RepID=UPI001FF7AE4C|nr:cytochrome P450 [Gordonia hongkongensis]UPG69142.1 cytochrome P450 [Gordonia hongkongensis]
MSLPHPPRRLPVIGDLIGMDIRTPMESLVEVASRTGPLFETTTMGAAYTIAAGADVVAELNDESRFAKHLGPELIGLQPAVGNGLFTADNDDPQWAAAHQLLVPAFSQKAMRRHHRVMTEVVGELLAHWDRQTGTPVDVTADMTRTALETIGRATAGHGFGGFGGRGRTDPFIRHMVGALRGSYYESFIRRSWLPAWTADLGERWVRHHGDAMARIVDDIVATRRRSTRAQWPDDLLSLMLTPGDDGSPILDEDNIRYQMITFLIAGHETTSGAMSFALHHLSTRPDLVDAARAEIDEVWGDDPTPDFEQVGKLRFVRRIVDETLRLHPTVPGYFRVAREDTTVADGHPVRAGEWFLVLVGGLHRDPRWGDDPDTLDPDRFLPERVRARPAQLYKPFGTGLRSCIGRQFAIHEAVLVLASILRRYDLAPTPGYRLRTTERLTSMPRGLRLTPVRRAGSSSSPTASSLHSSGR